MNFQDLLKQKAAEASKTPVAAVIKVEDTNPATSNQVTGMLSHASSEDTPIPVTPEFPSKADADPEMLKNAKACYVFTSSRVNMLVNKRGGITKPVKGFFYVSEDDLIEQADHFVSKSWLAKVK